MDEIMANLFNHFLYCKTKKLNQWYTTYLHCFQSYNDVYYLRIEDNYMSLYVYAFQSSILIFEVPYGIIKRALNNWN